VLSLEKKGRTAMIATSSRPCTEARPYTEADRLRELVIHAREGSPIATEAVRAHLRNRLTQAPAREILDLAERMMQSEKLSA
jgi:hypothetical protein